MCLKHPEYINEWMIAWSHSGCTSHTIKFVYDATVVGLISAATSYREDNKQNNNLSRYCHGVTSESLNEGRLMDKPHPRTGQESLAARALLLTAGEGAPHFPHPCNLLQWHHGQHPNQLHDQLVDELPCLWTQSSPKNCADKQSGSSAPLSLGCWM